MSEHECHFCESEERTTVVERYPCGDRLVNVARVGVCCKCGADNTFFSTDFLRSQNEPDNLAEGGTQTAGTAAAI